MADDLSGQTLKGYAIGERIGTGSFGAVYRATQASVGREVAIKIILPHYANHPDFIRRFETEAQIVARLEHPHIVPLFDYWREPDCAYLVMRLLPGSLRLQIEEIGALPLQDIVQWADQIASALAMSHRQGVVHRDIKPDNILLDSQGNAYLTDFGLAEVIKSSLDRPSENISGSPAYMSPEQLRSDAITPQSDLYALGIVLYEMLAGAHPFEFQSISDLIKKQLLEPLPPLHLRRADVPEAIDRVLQRATAKEVDKRYSDAQTLAADFREALLGRPQTVISAVEDTLPIKNPYKGLRAFEEVDAGDFFGREMLVERLIDGLADDHRLARFLAVVGPSGSGKSSLVQAGLIPALRRGALPGSERWFYLNMVPATQPLKALETSLLSVAIKPISDLHDLLRTDPRGLVMAANEILAGADSELVLVIDQFEEVFTLVSDEDERLQFLNLLQTAVTDPRSRVHVIVTLRADFYDRPLLYENFGVLMQTRTHIVLPLSEGELERAIIEPAQRVGVQLEPNLIANILADVRAEPGALPLLQYALTEVFERRQGRLMTLEGYEDIGRAAGALARRADKVFQRMTPEIQATARQVFLRLVTLGENANNMRRRAHRAELLSVVQDADRLEQVLDIFGRHRLLSFDHEPATREPTVEVAHEALLREWRALRQWLDDSREDVIQQRRLAGLAAEWLNADQDSSFLLRGAQLENFETWASRTFMALAGVERDFLAASVLAREKQIVEEQARRAREMALEARARQFRRGLVGVMFVATVIALILSFIAFGQRQEAQDARDQAQDNAFFAQTQAASAATAAAVAGRRADELQSLSLVREAQRALESSDSDLALALALAANRIPNAPIEAERLLGDVVPTAALRVFSGHTESVNTVAISPDGTRALSGGDDGSLILWNIQTGSLIRTLAGHSGRVRSVAFLSDGTHALSGADDAMLILWNLSTGEPIRTLTGHEDDVFAVAVSDDGQWAVSGGRDQVLIMWDLSTGEPIRRFGEEGGHESRITCVDISPDGKLLVSGSADNSLILWDVATGDIVSRLEQHRDAITDVTFSPDGTRLLSASDDQTLILWSVDSLNVLNRLNAHTERVSSVAFSPDGRLAISGAGNQFAGASTDNSIILWDLLLGQPIRHYQGHQFYVNDVAFNPDGRTFLSASADHTLRQWTVGYDIEEIHLDTGRQMAAVDFGSDGQTALAALPDNTLLWQSWVLSARFPQTRQFGEHSGAITAITISPDNLRALTASTDRTARLWELSSGALIYTLAGHTNDVNGVAFSPDRSLALTASRDRSLILWDMKTGEQVRVFETRHTNAVNAVVFSPDGTQALSASADQTVILWDVATGTAIKVLRGHRGPVTSVAFSPDGSWAVSGSYDKTVIVWDLDTGSIVHHFGAAGTGHTDWVTAVAISPDGTRVLSGSRDRSVILWDIPTHQIAHWDTGHADTVIAVQFAPGGQSALSVSADGVIRQWPATRRQFVNWAASHRYVRELSCEERDQYRLSPCP